MQFECRIQHVGSVSDLIYPLKSENVPLGVHVPQVGWTPGLGVLDEFSSVWKCHCLILLLSITADRSSHTSSMEEAWHKGTKALKSE